MPHAKAWKPYVPVRLTAADLEPERDRCPHCGHTCDEEFCAPDTHEAICVNCGCVLPGLVTGPSAYEAPPLPLRIKPASRRRVTVADPGPSAAERALDRVCGYRGITEHAIQCAKQVLGDVVRLRTKRVRVVPWVAAVLYYGCVLAETPRSPTDVLEAVRSIGLDVPPKHLASLLDEIPRLLFDESYGYKLVETVGPLASTVGVMDALLLGRKDVAAMLKILRDPVTRHLELRFMQMHHRQSLQGGFLFWASKRANVTLCMATLSASTGVSPATIRKVAGKIGDAYEASA